VQYLEQEKEALYAQNLELQTQLQYQLSKNHKEKKKLGDLLSRQKDLERANSREVQE
jgi:hypothetical protein